MRQIFNLLKTRFSIGYPDKFTAKDEGTNKIKILILTDNFSATYYLAFHYPLQSLIARSQVLLTVLSQKCVISKVGSRKPTIILNELLVSEAPNIVIFNRYGLPYGSIFLELCKKHGIPTIYFIDDDLLNIPTFLGSEIQKQHGNTKIINERQYLLAHVDLIYTSTRYLNNFISQIFPKQQVVHSIYPPYLEFLISKNKHQVSITRNNFKFGYMGSKGHQKDLEMVTPAIIQILQNYPDSEFETFGTISLPEKLSAFGNRVTSRKAVQNYDNFLNCLYNLNWDLGIAPLENHNFNFCKSPVKYLEYTASGIPTIASNILVYNQTINNMQNGILSEENEWYENIELVINRPDLRQEMLRQAQKQCSQEFALSITSEKVFSIVSSIRRK
jgi:glycosyltransferase involved in cell wall biosynthesis